MGRTLAVFASGEHLLGKGSGDRAVAGGGCPSAPPPRVHTTPPEKETAFETSAFPVPLRLSPSTMREVAAPAPKPVTVNSSPWRDVLLLIKALWLTGLS